MLADHPLAVAVVRLSYYSRRQYLPGRFRHARPRSGRVLSARSKPFCIHRLDLLSFEEDRRRLVGRLD